MVARHAPSLTPVDLVFLLPVIVYTRLSTFTIYLPKVSSSNNFVSLHTTSLPFILTTLIRTSHILPNPTPPYFDVTLSHHPTPPYFDVTLSHHPTLPTLTSPCPTTPPYFVVTLSQQPTPL
ncbi:hypothetical protein Pcinc_041446 [Petrolisthes cinctipes]|uniref:Uncharacterized protein n=1 Tax=Petrolisthes cinctipes TaxID=88211 RepID=A0AAE1BMI5_PETCI|nr:hypothetical protein Pcinc_041446 [Petrolisthes cinctipes]